MSSVDNTEDSVDDTVNDSIELLRGKKTSENTFGKKHAKGKKTTKKNDEPKPSTSGTSKRKKVDKMIMMSQRAGTVFPPSRFNKLLKRGRYADRVSPAAGVYAAAAMEYLVAEMLELAGNATTANKRKRITPRHIQLAIRNDEELNKLMEGVVIPDGGVVPHIHKELLPVKTEKQKDKVRTSSQEF